MQGLTSQPNKNKYYYFFLLIYFYNTDAYENFFICSYLRINLSNLLPYFNIFIALLHMYFFIFIKNYRYKTEASLIVLNDFLILIVFLNIYKIFWTLKNFTYFLILSWNKLSFFLLLNMAFNYKNWFYNFIFFDFKWYPLFKKYSYFGYYRVNHNAFIAQTANDFARIKS